MSSESLWGVQVRLQSYQGRGKNTCPLLSLPSVKRSVGQDHSIRNRNIASKKGGGN